MSEYRRLVRHFSNRLFESDTIARGGSLRDTIVSIVSLLAAAGIVVGYVDGMQFGHHASPAMIEALRWSNREFLLSLSMMIAAALSIAAWDNMFPDRIDCIILSQLPVRMRTVMAAKLTNLLSAFLIIVLAANAATGLLFPAVTAQAGHAALTFAAHFVSIFAASAFVFFAFLALQATLIHLLPLRLWRRISAWIQLGSLFTVLLGFFLIPPIAAPGVLTAPANRTIVTSLPPFWFLGLYQTMLGTADPVVHWLARRALLALAASVAIALTGYLAGYARYVRKTIDDSGVVASSRRARLSWIEPALGHIILRDPRERAVFWFAWRTMVRNRTPRLMLAAYASLGFVYVVDGIAAALKSHAGHMVARPNAAFAAFPLVVPFFLLLGMRILFTLPVEAGANWLFRLVVEDDSAAAPRGVRKLMIAAGVAPVCAASLLMYGAVWDWPLALSHVLLSALLALILVQMLTTGFHKIPFTCNFMPGKANLKATFAIYVVVFLFAAFLIVNLELWLLGSASRTATGAAAAGALLFWVTRRREKEETGPAGRLIYEERADWQLNTLDLT